MGLRVITFKLDDETLEMLDRYALTHGLTRSAAIRKAILKLLGENNTQKQPRITIKRIIIA